MQMQKYLHHPFCRLFCLMLFTPATLWGQTTLPEKTASPVLFAPTNITLPCTANYKDLAVTGNARIANPVSIQNLTHEDVETFFDACGKGMVLRRFTATDKEGNTVVAEQRIYVEGERPVVVHFPQPCCVPGAKRPQDLVPDKLPEGSRYPEVKSQGCAEVDVSYKDQIFQGEENGKLLLYRSWKVCSPCMEGGCVYSTQLIQTSVLPSELNSAMSIAAETPNQYTFELYQNKPNPFSNETIIGFTLPSTTTCRLVVQDVNGRILHLMSQ